jgi:hypothetical protein
MEVRLVVADCLREAGWPSHVDQLGRLGYGPYQPSEEDAFALAYYVCTERFPVDPRYPLTWSTDEHVRIREYLADEWRGCMAEMGIYVPLPHHEAVYLDNPNQMWFSPEDLLQQAEKVDERARGPLGPPALEEILVACPMLPPDFNPM